MLRIGMIILVLVSMFGFGNLAIAADQLQDRDRQYDTTPEHDKDPNRDQDRLHTSDPAAAATTDVKTIDSGDRDRDRQYDTTPEHDRTPDRDRDRIHTPSGSATRQGGK
jgi:hypothetical protein